MIRPIVKYGAPVLLAPSRPVDVFDESLHTLIDDLIETMYAAPGIGLAAPQVGVDRRVCVIDLSVGKRGGQVITLVNPSFVEREGLQLEEEGCLSVPGFQVTVPRPARVVVSGVDREGRPVTIEGTGLLARALQHEIDHLDGHLLLDRLKSVQRDVIVRRIKKQQRRGTW